MKYLASVFFVVEILLASFVGAIPRPDAEARADLIANSYIVVFKEAASKAAINRHFSWVNIVNEQFGASKFAGQKYKYNIGNFRGYAGQFSKLTIESVKTRPEVEFVEQDGIVKASDCVSQDIDLDQGAWGLARISNRQWPAQKFLYDNSRPACNYIPLHAYVIDSGVRVTHDEFEGRAELIWKAEDRWNEEDNCSHGTHVAGTIAGKTYGIARSSVIFALKVIEGNIRCNGTWAGVIAGLNYAYDHAGPKNRPKSVVNMSLGGPRSKTLNLAIESCVTGGLTVVVAAGNSGGDACRYSPSSAEGAITVGATNKTNSVTWFSNIGCCVDMLAPGEEVLSAVAANNTGIATYNGTSMASPHVAGIVLYNKCLYGLRTPEEDKRQLIHSATNDTLTGNLCIKGCCSSNSLVFNGGCNK